MVIPVFLFGKVCLLLDNKYLLRSNRSLQRQHRGASAEHCQLFLMTSLSVSVWSPVPPVVEPAFQDVRQGMGRSVTLRCTMLKGSPMKVATSVWRFNGTLLAQPPAEQQDYSELKVDSVSRETSGSYECSISNDVGVSACLFQVSGESQSTQWSEL